MIDRASQKLLMRRRVKSHHKHYMIRWLSSVAGSMSATALFTFLMGVIVLPKPSLSPQPFTPPPFLEQANSQPIANTRSIEVNDRRIANVPLQVVQIDLTHPHVFLGIGLANQARQANSARSTRGDEAFEAMVRRNRAAVTISGTFFSMDDQKRVMGNMVSGGRFLKYSPWENYGTTLGLRTGNRPEMVTARTEGKPQWERHWFSLTAGPRLLKNGGIQINPRKEGFTDPNVMGVAIRAAIGFSQDGKRLFLVTFYQPITLQKEAAIMRALGCYEAMNLDGGTSVGLAAGNRILHPAGRELTNVITVYDSRSPAPQTLVQSWHEFQRGDRVAVKDRR